MGEGYEKFISISLIALTLLLFLTACVNLTPPNPPNDNANPNDKTDVQDNGNDNKENVILVSAQVFEPLNDTHSVSEMSVQENPIRKATFRDDEYYYYVFYMGYVSHVPLQDNAPTFEFNGNAFSTSRTTTTTSETSVRNQIERIKSVNSSWSRTINREATLGIEKKDIIFGKVNASFKLGYESSFNVGTLSSTSEIAEKVCMYSEQTTETVNLTFDSSCKHGYYRYVLMGDFDVYGVVIYDPDTNEFHAENFVSLYKEYYTLDFSLERKFPDNTFKEFEWDYPEFDLNALGGVPDRYFSGETDNDIADEIGGSVGAPICLPMNIKNCDLDNGFNTDYQTSDESLIEHRKYIPGEYVIYGLKKVGDLYVADETCGKFSIQLKLNCNPTNLDGTGNVWICDDSATSANKTNISSRVGMGAVCVRVTFCDGSSQQQICKTNVLSGAYEGSMITLLSEDDLDVSTDTQAISKVEITFVYEIMHQVIKNFLYKYSNWRSDYTLNFVYN